MQHGWLRSIEPGSFGGDESVAKSRRDIIENAVLEDDSFHSQELLLRPSRNRSFLRSHSKELKGHTPKEDCELPGQS
jgi:hypothetical protein